MGYKARVVCLFFVFLLATSPLVYGQGNFGAITGTAQDSSGGVVPDLPLTITNVETGVKWTPPPAAPAITGWLCLLEPIAWKHKNKASKRR